MPLARVVLPDVLRSGLEVDLHPVVVVLVMPEKALVELLSAFFVQNSSKLSTKIDFVVEGEM